MMYSMELIHSGLQTCFQNLKADVFAKFGKELTTVGAIGIIGPTRMDYQKAVSVMKHMTDIVNSKMKEISSGGEDNE